MLDEGLVFHKTERGQQEIAKPGGALSPKYRRCLILIDGEKTLADLAPLFRPGEISAILEELQAGGYVALEGGAVATVRAAEEDSGPAIGAGVDPATFVEIRRRAMREVSDRLGPTGDPLAMKIERCTTPEELRAALRDAERILASFLGPEYAKTFAKKIGRDLA